MKWPWEFLARFAFASQIQTDLRDSRDRCPEQLPRKTPSLHVPLRFPVTLTPLPINRFRSYTHR